MPYAIEVKPDAPIILLTLEPSSDVTQDTPSTIPIVRRLLDEQPQPVFVIIDFSREAPDLDSHIKASIQAARGPDPVMHHPNARMHLFVGPDPLTQMAVKILSSPVFGRVRVLHFDTLEEALAYCYEQLAQEADCG